MSEHTDNAQPDGERTPVQIDLQQLLEAVQAHGQKTVDQQDEAAKDRQYDDAILDSSAIAPTDDEGNPVPVTIPIVLAPGVTVVYTTRLGGVSEGDFAHFNLGAKGGDLPERVRRNREALANELHARISLVNQVHSAMPVDLDDLYEQNASYGFNASGTRVPEDLVEVDAVEQVPSRDAEPQAVADDGRIQVIDADAQVTTRTGIALGVFAADCLPVLLADPEAGVIAAAHAGRKGLVDGVIGATVDMMVDKGAQRGRIVATLGPAICGDCYEVGDEIADAFDAVFPGTFTLTRFGGPGIDITKAALMALAKAGVDADRVFSSQPRVNAATQYLSHDAELEELCREDNEGDPALAERLGHVRHSMCTLENPLWFSHRRAQLAQKPHEGRMLALIVRQ